jgi:phage tail-like protein
MAVRRDDPYAAFNYRVTVTAKSGIDIRGAFSDVTGLSTEVTYADYREGTDPNHVRKVPTLYKVGDITLKRGLIAQLELFQWMDQVRKGNQDAKATVVIELRAENGADVVATWRLTNARPQKWTGPTLGAKSTEVAMEELVLVCEDMVFE